MSLIFLSLLITLPLNTCTMFTTMRYCLLSSTLDIKLIHHATDLSDGGFFCYRTAKIPSPPPGHKWKEVRHDNKVRLGLLSLFGMGAVVSVCSSGHFFTACCRSRGLLAGMKTSREAPNMSC